MIVFLPSFRKCKKFWNPMTFDFLTPLIDIKIKKWSFENIKKYM